MGKGRNRNTQSGTSRSCSKGQVRSMIRSSRMAEAELKAFVVSATGLAANTSGDVVNLTQQIVQGDTNVQRNGSSIFLKEIDVTTQSVCGLLIAGSFRYILVQDSMSFAFAPTVADVLQANTWISQFNVTNQIQMKRFRILFDYTVDISAAGPQNKTVRKRVRVGKKIEFLGTTNVVGSNGKGAIFLLVIASNNDTALDYSYSVVMKYHDQ